MSASNFLESAIANYIFRSVSLTAPTEINIGLFTTMPSEYGTGGVEPSAAEYARVLYGPGAGYWTEPQSGDGIVYNITTILFPAPTGVAWGTIVGFGIWDQLANLLFDHVLASALVVGSGSDAPKFDPGALRVIFS
jgi:hypothetical protein